MERFTEGDWKSAGEVLTKMQAEKHRTHGKSVLDHRDLECPCWGTAEQKDCAEQGCGVCSTNPKLLPYVLGD